MDALGPVVRDTDGRTFTLATFPEMMVTEPFPDLRGLIHGLLEDPATPAEPVRKNETTGS